MINNFSDDYKMFSNFYPCVIFHKGIKYPTVEHAYQASKSNDYFFWKLISNLPADKAGLAKRRGNAIKIRPDWEKVKLVFMEELLVKKFSQEKFKNKLLSTGDEILEEGNWWHDNFYGNCMCGKKEKCRPQGENHLGKLLMKIREELKKVYN